MKEYMDISARVFYYVVYDTYKVGRQAILEIIYKFQENGNSFYIDIYSEKYCFQ